MGKLCKRTKGMIKKIRPLKITLCQYTECNKNSHLVKHGFAASCRTCRNKECQQEVKLRTCTKFSALLPFEDYPELSKIKENWEYGCLELEYVNGQSVDMLQKCIVTEDISTFCQNIAKTLLYTICNVVQPTEIKMEETNFELTSTSEEPTITDLTKLLSESTTSDLSQTINTFYETTTEYYLAEDTTTVNYSEKSPIDSSVNDEISKEYSSLPTDNGQTNFENTVKSTYYVDLTDITYDPHEKTTLTALNEYTELFDSFSTHAMNNVYSTITEFNNIVSESSVSNGDISAGTTVHEIQSTIFNLDDLTTVSSTYNSNIILSTTLLESEQTVAITEEFNVSIVDQEDEVGIPTDSADNTEDPSTFDDHDESNSATNFSFSLIFIVFAIYGIF